jgi:hypothetical protein
MTALINQKCKIQPRFKTLKTFLGRINAFIPAKILSALTALKNLKCKILLLFKI